MRVQLRRKQAFVVEIHPFQRAPAADDAAVSTLVDVYNFGRTTATWIGFEANRHESRAYLARAIVTPPLRAPHTQGVKNAARPREHARHFGQRSFERDPFERPERVDRALGQFQHPTRVVFASGVTLESVRFHDALHELTVARNERWTSAKSH